MIFIFLLFFSFLILLVFMMIGMYYFNQYLYTRAINKKFHNCGYKIITIRSITQPRETLSDQDPGAFLIKYGNNPMSHIYKSVTYEDESHRKKHCMVIIKKMLFIITSIDYTFDKTETTHEIL